MKMAHHQYNQFYRRFVFLLEVPRLLRLRRWCLENLDFPPCDGGGTGCEGGSIPELGISGIIEDAFCERPDAESLMDDTLGIIPPTVA